MMAVVTITPVKTPLGDGVKMPTLTPLTSATDGAVIPFSGQDLKTVVLVKNAHASAVKTVTVKKGGGLQGVNDLTVSIPAGETHVFSLESGKYKQTGGTYKGNLHLVGESTDIQVGAVVLP